MEKYMERFLCLKLHQTPHQIVLIQEWILCYCPRSHGLLLAVASSPIQDVLLELASLFWSQNPISACHWFVCHSSSDSDQILNFRALARQRGISSVQQLVLYPFCFSWISSCYQRGRYPACFVTKRTSAISPENRICWLRRPACLANALWINDSNDTRFSCLWIGLAKHHRPNNSWSWFNLIGQVFVGGRSQV